MKNMKLKTSILGILCIFMLFLSLIPITTVSSRDPSTTSYNTPQLRSSTAENGPNATIYLDSIVDGTFDFDEDGLYDFFYINVTLEIHIVGQYFLVSGLNLSAIPSPQNPFPYVIGQDFRLYAGEVTDMTDAYIGDTINENITITLAFRGLEINATGMDGHLGIINLILYDMSNYDFENPQDLPDVALMIGTMDQAGPTIFTSTLAYSADQFEMMIRAFVQSWSEDFVDIENDGYYDLIHIIAEVNSTHERWIRLQCFMTGSQEKYNLTMVSKGVSYIDLWWASTEVTGDGPFEINDARIDIWDEDLEGWDYQMGWYMESPYITSTPLIPKETNMPEILYNQDNSTWQMRIEDIDSNGEADFAIVSIPVNFTVYGLYEFNAELYTSEWRDPGFNLFATNTSWFMKGNNTNVDLWFDIRQLVTISTVFDDDIFLGNVSYPNLNLTQWNYINIWGRPITAEYYGEFYVENYFTHANALLQEDIDPLPDYTNGFPFTTTETLWTGDQISYWFNISDNLSPFNLFNVTLEPIGFDFPYDTVSYLVPQDYRIIHQTLNLSAPWWGFESDYRYSEEIWANRTEYFSLYKYGPDIWALLTIQYVPRSQFCIPVKGEYTLTAEPSIDNTGPIVQIISPESGASLSDEFGFKLEANITDDISGVLGVDVFLSGFSAPLASTDPWKYYSQPEWTGPANITELRLFDGHVYVHLYPKSDWIGSRDLTVIATDVAHNQQPMVIPVTIFDDPTPPPDELINNGLNWIISQQQPDGSYIWSREDWRGHDDPGSRSVAFTSWAMLTLLQNGSRFDDSVVQSCYEYIKSQVQSDGAIMSWEIGQENYETSIALMGLIPLKVSYGVWGVENPDLDKIILDAVSWVIRAQNREPLGYDPSNPHYGGWGYGLDNATLTGYYWSDLSNSQWSIIALAAARDIGINIPAQTWTAAETFVRRCFTEVNLEETYYGFAYQPDGGWVNSRMNAAGIWCLALMGYDDTDSDINEALRYMNHTWIEQYVDDYFHSDGYRYYAIVSAAKALILTGHDKGTGYSWMYQSIYQFLTRHVIREADDPDLWYWDNTRGSEDPVYATLLAILSQQISYGTLGEAAFISITVQGRTHLHLYDENSQHTGYNYTLATSDSNENTTYSGPNSFPQQVVVTTPYKGYYYVYIYLIDDGEFNLTVSAKTTTGLTVTAKSNTFYGFKGETYYTSFVVTTIYGVNIELDHIVKYDGDFIVVGDPVIVGPNDLSFTENDGQTHELVWTVLEMIPPIDYTIQKDGVEVTTVSNWDGKGSVTLDVSDLPDGVYSYNFSATDASGLVLHDIVTVTVIESDITYSLSITDPTEGVKIKGTYLIKWTATTTSAESMTFKVEYKLEDDTSWTELASGFETQQFAWDTKEVDDGDYTIRVTIEGTTVSDEVDITIDNVVGLTPGFDLFTILGVVVILAFIRKKR